MNLRASLTFVILFASIPGLTGCESADTDQPNSKISASDEFAIKEVVLKDLVDFQEPRLHPIRPGILAYVIDDPTDGKRLAAAFAGHTPPVVFAATVFNEHGEDLDKVTGKPVEVYAVRIRENSCDHARVGAGWRSAPLVGFWYSYDLERAKGVWTLKKRTVVGVS